MASRTVKVLGALALLGVGAFLVLTRADKLMLGVYIALSLGMLSTWVMFLVEEHNMERVFRVSRVVVPSLTAIVMAFAIFS